MRAESSLGLLGSETLHALGRESWQPGRLHPNLSWTHYRTLVARSFYEIEAIQNHWSARELERQFNSLLFERLAKSRDKAGLMKLATQGQAIAQPTDVFKDPVVMEFLGLTESPRLVESKLEEALISNLQSFLLEMGKGFAFVSRQELTFPNAPSPRAMLQQPARRSDPPVGTFYQAPLKLVPDCPVCPELMENCPELTA